MSRLQGRIRAVVTGASRGVGRGIAEALGEAGAIVYATGRDEVALKATAASIDALGGQGVPVVCDHRDDDATEALFARVRAEQGGVDVLANSAWGGYADMVVDGQYTWEQSFWEQPLWRWDAMFAGGLRAAYAASRLAAQSMVLQGRGLIVNLSSFAGQGYVSNVAYGVSKAATDRLSADMARELRSAGVSVVSLYPGMVRTEKVLAAGLELDNSESPRFVGRAVAALAGDTNVLDKSGRVLVVAALASDYGFDDVDGKRPTPLGTPVQVAQG